MKALEKRVKSAKVSASMHSARSLVAAATVLVGVMSVQTLALQPSGGYSAPYMQADYVQNVSEWSAGMINPALLWRVNQPHFEFGAYRWGIDFDNTSKKMGYQQGSLIIPVRTKFTFGATWLGDMIKYDKASLDANGDIQSGSTGHYGEQWIVGHASFKVLPFLSVGVNPKVFFMTEPAAGVQSTAVSTDKTMPGWGLDAGLYLDAVDNYRFGNLGFSAMLQDIKPPVVKYDDGTREALNSRLRFGARYTFGGPLYKRLVFGLEGTLDGAMSGWGKTVASVGGNSAQATVQNAKTAFRMSAHGEFVLIPLVTIKAGWDNNTIPYIGGRLNFMIPVADRINFFSIDGDLGYSFADILSVNSKRGMTAMAKGSLDFGQTREQRESKRMYELLVMAPMNDYNEAMRLYTLGKYWEASFAFGKVLALYPNFHLSDNVTFYMGDCYSHLYLNGIARQVFKQGLADYPTSATRSRFLYGLELLDYREGKFDDALKNHSFIVNLYPESEVRSDADYVAGQIQFQRKNISGATQLLSNVKKGAASYLYAQYTLAAINIDNSKVPAAIQNLQAVVSDSSSSDPSLVLLRAAGDNKLGQLYFEQVELKNAVEAFKRVPDGTPYYDQALIGIGWSWIKANRAQECLAVVNQLISVLPKSSMVPEAYLLKGYAQLIANDPVDASAALQKAIELCKANFRNDDSLTAAKADFSRSQQQFDPTAQSILKNAMRKPSQKVLDERGGFKSSFESYDHSVSAYFNMVEDVENSRDFFRRKDQIQTDAEYALAKASKALGQKKANEIVNEGAKKTQEVDKELEQLQEQLKQLQNSNGN